MTGIMYKHKYILQTELEQKTPTGRFCSVVDIKTSRYLPLAYYISDTTKAPQLTEGITPLDRTSA